VIVATGGTVTPLAAKAATTTVPIVFIVPGDPVKLELVASFARPDGNLTGVNIFNLELTAKRLELLRQLVPGARRLAVLVNPTNTSTKTTLRDVEAAARTMGLQVQVHNASTNIEINAVFASFGRDRPDALFVGGDPFFNSRRVQFATLTAHYSIPTAYTSREYVEAGGLMSYGASFTDSFRLAGTYVGRILKGAKPADLPITQPTKFELVINAEIARMLGLNVPPTLLALADEVIE
jgi:putative ABC transport system substrate-binding protein